MQHYVIMLKFFQKRHILKYGLNNWNTTLTLALTL